MAGDDNDSLLTSVPKARASFEDAHHMVEGLYLNTVFTAENIRSALSYEPLEDDVFVVSYPKCGTTWLQHIVIGILSGGTLTPDDVEDVRKATYLELIGAEGARTLRRPVPIKTHLPFHKQPYSAGAKYVYVTRNPYDCCISYYYHYKGMPWHRFAEGTFNEFVDMFVRGKVSYGDYFDHLLSWYERRNHPNVLFLTYEELKKDTPASVLRIADFCGALEYGKQLRTHPSDLEKVLRGISLEVMRKLTFTVKVSNSASLTRRAEGIANTPSSDELQNENLSNSSAKGLKNSLLSGQLVRKGIVGDWKSLFSSEQIQRMKAWIAPKTRDTDVMNLWKDVDLP
ncbi:sulfotransferase ssu-1-like [Dermacentor andersoni]|uniref:sulfotransferase ssu-1-like n=1 Tax=Dermacentor andersoni TaxID=34620 RepID=UPI002416C6D1|nr:sulfotransferase ssu-1-like [Dermacentor andersoni]